MKKYILPFLPLLAIIVGVVAAFGTGGADEPTEPVVLGEEDLIEQVEIWRNQYRRMTPGDGPLVQDVGELPAAWEEFGNHWSSAPAERDLATWLVPFSAERQGVTTIIRDASGAVLWSGTTDFAQSGSTNVILTGALVDETDWPLYDAARREVLRCLGEMDEMHGGIRGTNGPLTNGLRFTNMWAETNGDYRLDFAWEEDGDVQVFCRAMHSTSWVETVVWTNDENEVLTNDFTRWRQLDTFRGRPDAWALLGVATITNGGGSFTDTTAVPDWDRVRFYAAAKLGDQDNDGITDGEEWLWGITSPTTDTDNDGLTDFQERKLYGTDPDNPGHGRRRMDRRRGNPCRNRPAGPYGCHASGARGAGPRGEICLRFEQPVGATALQRTARRGRVRVPHPGGGDELGDRGNVARRHLDGAWTFPPRRRRRRDERRFDGRFVAGWLVCQPTANPRLASG